MTLPSLFLLSSFSLSVCLSFSLSLFLSLPLLRRRAWLVVRFFLSRRKGIFSLPPRIHYSLLTLFLLFCACVCFHFDPLDLSTLKDARCLDKIKFLFWHNSRFEKIGERERERIKLSARFCLYTRSSHAHAHRRKPWGSIV